MYHILIVEDDQTLAKGLCRALTSDTISADFCSTIKRAKELLLEDYALVILDVNLPDGNGFDFLKELKAKSQIAVILLTANDMETDIVTGLELGGGGLYYKALFPCCAAGTCEYTASQTGARPGQSEGKIA